MNHTTKELLEQIQDWMCRNDYECGEEGAEIFAAIDEELQRIASMEPKKRTSGLT